MHALHQLTLQVDDGKGGVHACEKGGGGGGGTSCGRRRRIGGTDKTLIVVACHDDDDDDDFIPQNIRHTQTIAASYSPAGKWNTKRYNLPRKQLAGGPCRPVGDN